MHLSRHCKVIQASPGSPQTHLVPVRRKHGRILLRRDEDESGTSQVISFEQDILPDLADTRQFFVLETRDFWRQIKTAGSAVPANALYLTKAFQAQSAELTKPSATMLPPVYIHPTARVDPTAKLGPNVSIGPRTVIGAWECASGTPSSWRTWRSGTTLAFCTPSSAGGARLARGPASRASPLPVTSHSTTVIKNGVKVQSITILGKECSVGDEVKIQNCVCLPYKGA